MTKDLEALCTWTWRLALFAAGLKALILLGSPLLLGGFVSAISGRGSFNGMSAILGVTSLTELLTLVVHLMALKLIIEGVRRISQQSERR